MDTPIENFRKHLMNGRIEITRQQKMQLSSCANLIKIGYITTLYIKQQPITTLAGIEQLSFLTSLSVVGCKLTDISALSNCMKLESADLKFNSISQIPQLPLTLQILSLQKNQITEFQQIQELKNSKLFQLKLDENPICSQENFERTLFQLLPAQIVDFSPLKKDLKTVFKENPDIVQEKTVQFVQQYNGQVKNGLLEVFDDLDCKVFCLEPFVVLQELDQLKLKNINLTLKGVDMLFLKTLHLVNCGLTTLQPLQDLELSLLTNLNLSQNQLQSLKNLESCPNLQFLDVSQNQLQNLEEFQLQELKKLENLKLFGNPFADFQQIEEFVMKNTSTSLIYLNLQKDENELSEILKRNEVLAQQIGYQFNGQVNDSQNYRLYQLQQILPHDVETLLVSGCRSLISVNVEMFTNLQEIILQKCGLTKLIWDRPLKNLDLSGNLLEEVEIKQVLNVNLQQNLLKDSKCIKIEKPTQLQIWANPVIMEDGFRQLMEELVWDGMEVLRVYNALQNDLEKFGGVIPEHIKALEQVVNQVPEVNAENLAVGAGEVDGEGEASAE